MNPTEKGLEESKKIEPLLEVLGSIADAVWDIKSELTEIRKAILLPEKNKEWEKDSEARRRRGL